MKEKVPDLTAYPLDEAISILKKMNLDFFKILIASSSG